RRAAVRQPRAAAAARAARRRGQLAGGSLAAAVEPPPDGGWTAGLAEAARAAAADALAVRLFARELHAAGAAELRAHGLPRAAGRRPCPPPGPGRGARARRGDIGHVRIACVVQRYGTDVTGG